ncbi:MAG: hypothetical protein JNL87_02530 [Burkholderiaceae bacterium]|nr:hypothetical protein [Burkholderiaceae bacterium]
MAAPGDAPRAAALLGASLILLALCAAAVLAMQWPSAGDAGRRESAAALSPQQQYDMLKRHLERQPRDGRGWVLFAMREFEADRFDAAAAAFERAVTVSRRVAADPAVWCEYADALGMARGGRLEGKPTELIHHALSLRGDHPKALEMAGSAAYERRDFAAAARYWRQLLPQMHQGSRQQAELTAAIERADRLAATSLR